ncbi:CPBP family intramembrane glutamic endopeptidase [Paenibacillus sp. VCA1]|uniref:CPBP family intramembrane glutamic endopeptidase n=1 Tax=Paenibacillus sp. VCA1 TaxID=3039148 RepID=UPI0028716598|nr:CPBP family intramembrane glutamic endopeptidase [Paenibacillus sp. VCA1]MDR9852578.1 CPBP family intramembrane glutamic endopeptidase [Paenibacillus sp. VCA1]
MKTTVKPVNLNVPFSEKRPILSVVLIELLLLAAMFAAGAYATVQKLSYTAPVLIAFIPISIVLLIGLTWKKSWRRYGFLPLNAIPGQNWIYYLPLVLVLGCIALNGFRTVSVREALFFVLFTLLVGFVEETVYRGLILHIMLRKKSIAAAVITSSLLFSVTHVLNMLSGQSAEDTVVQLVYALLTGAALALLIVKNKNILPLIFYHFIHNLIQFLGPDGRSVSVMDYVVLAILLLHCLWLILSLNKEKGAARISGSFERVAP